MQICKTLFEHSGRSALIAQMRNRHRTPPAHDKMSALGHEQTSRHVRVMSVITLKADIRKSEWHVRLVPIPNIARVPILLFQRSFVSRTQLCPSFFQFSLTINLVALSL